jgi:uncharacterized membrane protein YidH (DUF202 family)
MKTIGLVLVVLGVLALVYGGISYNRNRTLVDVGSLNITTSERRDIRIPTVAGALVLIGGVAMILTHRRRA